MPEITPWGTKIRNAFKPGPTGFRGFYEGSVKGYGVAVRGNLPFVLAYGTYAAIQAPTGHKISALAGGGIGFSAAGLAAGAIGGIFGIPPMISATIAGVLLGDKIDRAITNVVQGAVDFGSRQRRMNFGGDYRDTQVAYTMRQTAAREMGGSLMNARQWLGQESAFMHQ
jgi:hypothetical protein